MPQFGRTNQVLIVAFLIVAGIVGCMRAAFAAGVTVGAPSLTLSVDGCSTSSISGPTYPDEGDTITVATTLTNSTGANAPFRVVFRAYGANGSVNEDLLYGGPTWMYNHRTTGASPNIAQPSWDDSFGEVVNTPSIKSGSSYTVKANLSLLKANLNALGLGNDASGPITIRVEVYSYDFSSYYGTSSVSQTIQKTKTCPGAATIVNAASVMLTTSKVTYVPTDTIYLEWAVTGAFSNIAWGDQNSVDGVVDVLRMDVPPTGDPETDYTNNLANIVKTFDSSVTAFGVNKATASVTGATAIDSNIPVTLSYDTVTGSTSYTATNTFSLAASTLTVNKNYLVRFRPSTGSVIYGSASHPVRAPQWNYFSVRPATATAVRLASAEAVTRPGSGTDLRWRTGYEVDNLGFNVYREDAAGRTRLNRSLIAGSALVMGHGRPLEEGQTYSWRDPNPEPARYWIEDVDLLGRSTWNGPFNSQAGAPPENDEDAGNSVLLTAAGREEEAETTVRQAERASTPRRIRSAAALSLAGARALKISVNHEGWVRVTQQQLAQAGFTGALDPRALHLYAEGQEIPCLVRGESDGKLGSGDAVEFYGIGADLPGTDRRVYWLTVGSGPGLRVPLLPSVPGAPGPDVFPYTVEWSPRTQYFAALHNGGGNKFFGPAVTTAGLTQTFGLPHLRPGSAGTIEVATQGVSANAAAAPNHHVRVSVNGTPVGALTFNGTELGSGRFAVPAGVLVEGENFVALQADGADADVSVVDHVRITYGHEYAADGAALRCVAQPGQKVSVSGFTSTRVRALDVTDVNAPQELTPDAHTSGGLVSVTAPVAGAGPRVLYLFADDAAYPPAAVTVNTPSAWLDSHNRADLLIISPVAFARSLAPLVQSRQRQKLQTAVVDIADVYDECSYGQKDPAALRAFIQNAVSRWTVKPRWVLLAGAATFDPRNYLGSNVVDYVPTRLVETSYAETASDDWFADFNDDGLPDLAVGRLPVTSATETAAVVKKLAAYDKTLRTDAWRKSALLVSDRDDVLNFGASNEQVLQALPQGFSARRVYRETLTDSQFKSALLDGFNTGSALVNYNGHGSVEIWAGGLFGTSDAKALADSGKLPVIASMTCLNGYFISVRQRCLADTLLTTPSVGAAAVWASSSLTQPELQTEMNREFYRRLAAGATFGEAAAAAKAASTDPDVRRTWVLFGDPSMRLH